MKYVQDRLIVRAGIPVESVGWGSEKLWLPSPLRPVKQAGAGCRKIVVSLFGVFDGHSGSPVAAPMCSVNAQYCTAVLCARV